MADPDGAPGAEGGGEPPFDFAAAFERARHKRCGVASVALSGNARTKDHVILRELQPVRQPRGRASPPATHALRRLRCVLCGSAAQVLLHAQTLEEVKEGLLDACTRLSELDIFSSVDLLADKSAEVRRRWQHGRVAMRRLVSRA